VAVNLPTMSPGLGGTAATVTGTVTLNTTGYYNKGVALITNGGQLVDVVSLDDALAATGAAGHADFTFNNVPGGIPQARYGVSVRLWNSNNPASTLARVSANTPADVRNSSDAQVAITAP
jgi:Tfp pilus assembly protein PilV